MRATGLFLWVVLAALNVVRAEITVTPPSPQEHGLVRVDHDTGTRLGVLSRELLPVDMERISPTRFVFAGPPGRYVLIGFDDAGNFITRVVEIGGKSPPQPDPDPKPDPDPPPKPVPNQWGFGKAAHDSALALRDPAGCRAVSAAWLAGAQQLYKSQGQVADIQAAIDAIKNQSAASLGANRDKWLPWASGMSDLFREKKLTTALEHTRAFQEVASALGVAANVR